jgi:hypothetical protein
MAGGGLLMAICEQCQMKFSDRIGRPGYGEIKNLRIEEHDKCWEPVGVVREEIER